jgi:8-oxo-dGTP pyrophosphatase MutT (NUDIX family)
MCIASTTCLKLFITCALRAASRAFCTAGWSSPTSTGAEAGETPAQAAVRELFEEVGAELDPAHLTFLGEWTAPAANEPDHTVHGHIFEHPWIDGLSVRAEIEDLLWLHPDEMATRDDLAPLLVTRVLPALAPEVR